MSICFTAHCLYIFLINALACHLFIDIQIMRNFKSYALAQIHSYICTYIVPITQNSIY